MPEKKDYSEKCTHCGEIGKFIPPSKTDIKRKKLIVHFKCPNGHGFVREFDMK